MSYINPRHSKEIRELFPDIAFHGIDLDNVEIKESESKIGMFTYSNIDFRAEYILFYHRKPHSFFYIVDIDDMPNTKSKRGIRITQIKKLAKFKTKSKDKIKEYVNELRNKYQSMNESVDEILNNDICE